MKMLKLLKPYATAALGVVVGSLFLLVLRSLMTESAPSVESESVPQVKIEEVLGKHLGWAEQTSKSGVDSGVKMIRDFFAEVREQTRYFAQDALGFDSKWKMAADYLSGTKEHERFLQERFEERVFAPEELEEVIASTVEGYVNFLGDVDSQLLVRLQADLGEVSVGGFAPEFDRERIQKVLADALQEASQAVEEDFRGMVGREAVSWTAGEVLAVVGVRLMTSAGILSAGAGSGTVTFGAGLLIGLATDFVVSEVYNELFDPVGELSRKLDAKLSEMEELLLHGNETTPGLENYLREYSALRSTARTQALHSVFPRLPQLVSELQ